MDLKDFITYMPRTHGSLRQRKPHIRVETQDNGRTRFHFYAAVRDWLKLEYDRDHETYVEMLVEYDSGKIIIIKSLHDVTDPEPTAIPVRGLSNNGYITLPGFTYDFPIWQGKYEAELMHLSGQRAVMIDASDKTADDV